MDACIKQEPFETPNVHNSRMKTDVVSTFPDTVIELNSSNNNSDSDSYIDLDNLFGNSSIQAHSRVETGTDGGISKKRRMDEGEVILPLGFLSPLPS